MRLLSLGMAAAILFGATFSQTVGADADLVKAAVGETVTGGLFAGQPIADSPFSAVATTTYRGRLGDGRRLDQTSAARYFRDRTGRVRVEQLVAGGQARITVQRDIAKGLVYLLTPDNESAIAGPRIAANRAVGGGPTFALPINRTRFIIFRERLLEITPDREPLGTRTIEGVAAVGWRLRSADGRTYERWESPDLHLVVSATHADERMGTIEYRLTNIRRAEPPPELFEIPDVRILSSTNEPCWISLVPAEFPQDLSVCELPKN